MDTHQCCWFIWVVGINLDLLDSPEPVEEDEIEFDKELENAADIMLKTSSLELEVLEDWILQRGPVPPCAT